LIDISNGKIAEATEKTLGKVLT